MEICVDSNILLYTSNRDSPFYEISFASVSDLITNGNRLTVFPQNLIEFWAVCTRPILSNGFGLTTGRAKSEITRIKSIFRVIDETPAIYPEWQSLVVAHGVSGKNVHDARIAAQMRVNNIENILTFNSKDFKRFEHIIALEPASV